MNHSLQPEQWSKLFRNLDKILGRMHFGAIGLHFRTILGLHFDLILTAIQLLYNYVIMSGHYALYFR